jgi:hypothetical protein
MTAPAPSAPDPRPAPSHRSAATPSAAADVGLPRRTARILRPQRSLLLRPLMRQLTRLPERRQRFALTGHKIGWHKLPVGLRGRHRRRAGLRAHHHRAAARRCGQPGRHLRGRCQLNRRTGPRLRPAGADVELRPGHGRRGRPHLAGLGWRSHRHPCQAARPDRHCGLPRRGPVPPAGSRRSPKSALGERRPAMPWPTRITATTRAVVWGVGGASQQSRCGLLDDYLFCMFIHRQPWS